MSLKFIVLTKFRVRLEKGSSDDIDSIQTAESASDKRSAAEELELRELFRFNRIKSCAEIDEYVFSWQEKIFSLVSGYIAKTVCQR